MRSFCRTLAAAACLTNCLLLAGCATTEEETKAERPGESVDFNRLWRAGYGFNNPNPERMRKGLPPEDFTRDASRSSRSTSGSSTPTITLPPVKLQFD